MRVGGERGDKEKRRGKYQTSEKEREREETV